jgi:hypothetical protein
MSRLFLLTMVLVFHGIHVNAQPPSNAIPLAMPNVQVPATTATPVVVDMVQGQPTQIHVTVSQAPCANCDAKSTKAKSKLASKLNKNCGTDPCPNPIGCGNFWTESRFIFGSCRSFFGTGTSASGCCPPHVP